MNPELLIPEIMSPEVQAFATGFPITLLHAGVTVVMLILGAALYALLTPYKEISLIRDGNSAAAVAFGGVLIGLAIPLAVSLSASTSIREIAVWGAATIVVQLLVFRITDFLLTGLPSRIQEGEVSAAVLLVAAKIATAIILAAAVAG
ncbi:DUF350 domain-containing protein [Caulobacter sp. 17J80-11]|uniref:DUF350 domain-containing protein n=1 Tax=Caulobacter sp. 17J80-11 TaxID=2763502 RepID=UPI00351C1A6D